MITAKLDLVPLFKKLRNTPALLHAELQLKLTDEARLLVSSSGKIPGLVQVTPPFGGKSGKSKGNAAKKLGEAAVARDIRRVYATPGRIFLELKKVEGGDYAAARAFYAAAKKKKWAEANAILSRFPSLPSFMRQGLQAFDDGAEHDKRRNPRTGRVGSKVPSMFIADPRWVTRYIKERQKRVGLLASSLPAAAGSRFGKISGVPSWVSRHQGRWGICRVQRSPTSLHMVLGLSRSAGEDLQTRFNSVLSYRIKALNRQLPYIKRAALKKARMQQIA